MVSILIIEDTQGKADSLKLGIEEASKSGPLVASTVDVIVGTDVEGICNDVLALFGRQVQVFDVLLLDIHFQRDSFGGIKVYNNLVALGKRARWKETAICTKWRLDTTEDASRITGWQVVKIFAMTAFIPDRYIVDSRSANRNEKIIEIIDEVSRVGMSPACPVCKKRW